MERRRVNLYSAALAGFNGVIASSDAVVANLLNNVGGTGPLSADSLANGVRTLTNKTLNLANNTLTGTRAQFNAAMSDADFASLAAVEALTNKDLSSATNTPPTALPRGVLGVHTVTSGPSGINASIVDSTLQVTVTVGTSRRVRISAYLWMVSTVAGDLASCQFVEGATVLIYGTTSLPVANNGLPLVSSVILTPSAGAHTYKVQVFRAVGSGSVTMSQSVNNPAYLLVEDIGPA